MTKKTSEIVSASEFINLYKEYETVLRDILNTSPYLFEEAQQQPLNNKLQIIRLNRNYIQHESDPDFVKISRDQYDLLQNIINTMKLKKGCAKDKMVPIRKYPHLYDDMTVTEAVDVFAGSETDRIPVIRRQTGQFLGICTSMQFLKYVSKARGTTKLIPQRAGKERLELDEAPTTEVDSILCDLNQNCLYIVTKNGKTVGILRL